MSFVNLKNATIPKLVSEDAINLWVVDKLPPEGLSPYRLLTVVADENDTIYQIQKKLLIAIGIKPHREHYKRAVQFGTFLKNNINLLLIVKNAHLLKKESFTSFVLIAEQAQAVILQGEILSIGAKTLANSQFIQRADFGVYVDDVFVE